MKDFHVKRNVDGSVDVLGDPESVALYYAVYDVKRKQLEEEQPVRGTSSNQQSKGTRNKQGRAVQDDFPTIEQMVEFIKADRALLDLTLKPALNRMLGREVDTQDKTTRTRLENRFKTAKKRMRSQ
jgi:hypothetical protein